MSGLIFSILVSIGVPLAFFVYACFRKQYIVFILGALAFVVSQILLRIPLLQYLGKNSTEFTMFSATHPVLFAMIICFLAGVFVVFVFFFFICLFFLLFN